MKNKLHGDKCKCVQLYLHWLFYDSVFQKGTKPKVRDSENNYRIFYLKLK